MNFVEFNNMYIAVWGENALGVYTKISQLVESSKYVKNVGYACCYSRERAEHIAIHNYNSMQRNGKFLFNGSLGRDNWLCYRNNIQAY